MGFVLTGVAEMADKIRQAAAKFPDAVAKALYQEAQIEMTESKRRVPVDTGTLRGTGFVAEPEYVGNKISVMLAYGTDYALIVHEDLEAYHPIGQAKYLESVLKESSSHMAQRLAKRLDLNNLMRKL